MNRNQILALALITLLCLLVGIGAGVWIAKSQKDSRSMALTNAAPPVDEALLPPAAIVIGAKSATHVVAPMVLIQEAASIDSPMIALPQTGLARADQGSTLMPFTADTAASYHVWARVRWNDSCGNSILLAVDAQNSRTIGQDSLYNAWHWVKAGQWQIAPGKHTIGLRGREDGVALSQILLVPDSDYQPTGPIVSGREQFQTRVFADDFSRSPGSGLGEWQIISGKWGIEFTLDPNRIPYQYAFRAHQDNAATQAMALISGPAWSGCRLAFSSLTVGKGELGVVLGKTSENSGALKANIVTDNDTASLRVTSAGRETIVDLGTKLLAAQWNRIVVEHWAWVLKISINDETVFTDFSAGPYSGAVGLTASGADTIFDNIEAEEILWRADDGKKLAIEWTKSENARWYRSSEPADGPALYGRSGTISVTPTQMKPVEVLIEQDAATARPLHLDGFEAAQHKGNATLYESKADLDTISIKAHTDETLISRIAFRCGSTRTDMFRIGPYNFNTSQIEDPSDYLDFTDEEYEEISTSPDSDKLKRQRQTRPLLGRSPNGSVWRRRRGQWGILRGVLTGRGHNSSVSHWQDILSDFEMKFKVQMDIRSIAEIEFFSGENGGPRLLITNAEDKALESNPSKPHGGLTILIPKDKKQHDVTLRVTGTQMSVVVDGKEPASAPIKHTQSGAILLKVAVGSASFDDIEFNIPRQGINTFLYGFDRREPDWVRTGAQWIDHGGFSCILASSWLSLIAPHDKGIAWNRRPIGSDATVAFDVEESSEWFGWKRRPSHVHHAMDNIQVYLSPSDDASSGYRLEVNSRNRTATVLYRNDKEVASVTQGAGFPIRGGGSHSPYNPRRNRISFTKDGDKLHAVINGKTVLSFKDPAPLTVNRVGLGGYNTRFNLSHIEIRKH